MFFYIHKEICDAFVYMDTLFAATKERKKIELESHFKLKQCTGRCTIYRKIENIRIYIKITKDTIFHNFYSSSPWS